MKVSNEDVVRVLTGEGVPLETSWVEPAAVELVHKHKLDEIEVSLRERGCPGSLIESLHLRGWVPCTMGLPRDVNAHLPLQALPLLVHTEGLPMHQGSCHCGAVRLTLPSTPEVATDCNCSLCRRIGGPWVYFEFGTVTIEGHPGSTEAYVQGDKTLRTIRCRHCGCVTHWEPIEAKAGARHGVHLGNFDPQLIASVRVRKFDGADTWKFFDE